MLRGGSIAAALLAGVAVAEAQLRVATWNITNYESGRVNEFGTALYGSYEGRQFAPDVLVVQELMSAVGAGNFLAILNGAAGSPGDWAAALFVDGPDTDSCFYYRTSRVVLEQTVVVSSGGSASGHPRHAMRYDFHLVGYAPTASRIVCYVAHMKSGTSSAEKLQRLNEALAIKADAKALPFGTHFMLAGDLNVKSAVESAYFLLVGDIDGDDGVGRMWDPCNSRDEWGDNYNYRFLHSHDTTGVGGGMDDRFDQILLSGTLIDGLGMDYRGDAGIRYSWSTWNDPNHSYRVWGNDGTTFNVPLNIATNEMVGPTIAQALVDTGTFQGHLPVYLELLVPPVIAAPLAVDFGSVPQGAVAASSVTIENVGDVAQWNAAGIQDLHYTFAPPTGFGAPSGLQVEPAGGGGAVHLLTMDTATPGTKSGTLVITSDDPARPSVAVQLVGEVTAAGGCAGDLDGDGATNFADFSILASCWAAPCGDLDGDATTGFSDFAVLASDWNCAP